MFSISSYLYYPFKIFYARDRSAQFFRNFSDFIWILIAVVTCQVCKNFQRITTHRTVWWDAYKRSGVLRAPGPLESHSTKDLECLLVKASKLDQKFTSPSPQPVSRRTIAVAPQIGFKDIDLLFGRYLLVFGRNELVFFDLDAADDNFRIPIFSYGTQNESNMFLHFAIGPNHGTENVLLAVTSRQSFQVRGKQAVIVMYVLSRLTMFVLCSHRYSPSHIFNICPLEFPQIRHIAEIPTTPTSFKPVMSVGNDFLLLRCDGETTLLHIPSRTSFQLVCIANILLLYYKLKHCCRQTLAHPQGLKPYELIMISTHILAFYTNFDNSSGYLEAFPFPAISSPSLGAGRSITSSHAGPLPFAFTEPMMTEITAGLIDSEIVMTLLALAYSTSLNMTLLYLFRITLPPRSTVLTFTEFYHVPLDRLAFDLHGSASNGGARAICSLGFQPRLFTYTIFKDDNGDVQIKNGTVLGDLEDLHPDFGSPFDAIRGRLCYFNSEEIYILDYI